MLLAYCIAGEVDAARLVAAGQSQKLFFIEEEGLRVICSELSGNVRPGAVTIEEAREFNRVLQALFQHTDVLPFRYPTVVAGEDELRAHLLAHADAYRKAMDRLRGTVQFHFKISPAATLDPEPASGTDYMRQRLSETQALDHAAKQAREALADKIIKWREQTSIRPAERHGQTRQCYALVRREDATAVQQAIAAASFDERASVLVSGPWPPTEFFRQAETPESPQP